MVDGNANGAGKGSRETGTMKLAKSETTAKTDLTGIAASGRRDNWAKRLDGTGEHLSGLLIALHAASVLFGGLIEVGGDALDPVLAEMDVRDRVVVLDHC